MWVLTQKVKDRDQEIDELASAYREGEPDAVITYNSMVLERSEYPDDFPQNFRLAYVPESKELVLIMNFLQMTLSRQYKSINT